MKTRNQVVLALAVVIGSVAACDRAGPSAPVSFDDSLDRVGSVAMLKSSGSLTATVVVTTEEIGRDGSV